MRLIFKTCAHFQYSFNAVYDNTQSAECNAFARSGNSCRLYKPDQLWYFPIAMEKKYTFSDLSEPLRQALEDINITELSDVQAETIPQMLAGKDVLVKAATAAGKTYAFAIPLAETAEPQGSGKHLPFALVLVPTRELALQCAKMIRLLFAKKEGVRTAVLAGGEDMNRQVRMFSKGADIVVATPARLLDHLRRHTFKTKMLQTVILDEADVMVSMGFFDDVIRVFEQLGPHQTALFSATYPARVQSLCEQLLHDPVIIEIRKETVHTQSIQYYYRTVSPDHKLDALAGILKKEKKQVLVFVNRRRTAEFVSEKMQERKLNAACIHSELEMAARKKIMEDFRNGKIRILAATDILARGIDLPDLDCAVLYDYPEDPETVLHRSGRTSRQMQAGKVIFLLEKKELHRLKEAENILHSEITKLTAG